MGILILMFMFVKNALGLENVNVLIERFLNTSVSSKLVLELKFWVIFWDCICCVLGLPVISNVILSFCKGNMLV